ncbi:CDP-glycerol glycerophosphotransferase family protein [Shewanella eurypsychrophilus]|uniref:CDP-glycerol glycerophosphotransferase family protein n=1 Tax=Shewanella eurypsychrophilus TaxID=2593656 RepID=A0ABX6V7T0_9GAMM|nr:MULTISPECIES: CDP-glycerol glycerophosphotransferase family protein [Shewanella]QFU23418.1 CDP-glycerol glycerophosphotransferase family protein [Shewanella sp. YLB-09]QPG58646.1 CDP-glycerol glycerophosphotransferase family protein [Shewanella eurypsychrophilus]
MSTYLLLLRKIIYFTSGFFPRVNKAVMGSYKDQFCDNAKYLYLHWQRNQFIKTIWISGDINIVKQLNNEGYEAYHRWSYKGLFHCLTAKYYFYNSYIGDINQYLAKGAIKVNLWHGSPLKKIEFDITSGPLANTYHSTSAFKRISNSLKFHQQHVRPDLMLSPSPIVDSLYSSAFRLSNSKIHRCGNPRTDYYRRYPEKKCSLTEMFKHKYAQVILYAPTWNDQTAVTHNKSQQNQDQQEFNWQALSKQLQQSNQLFLVRFHPNEAHLGKRIGTLDNIIDISHWQDVYNILHDIDLLITDQSSLFIDLLLHNIPTLFYHQKTQQASSQTQTSLRENYDYTQHLPLVGKAFKQNDINSFQELLQSIKTGSCFEQSPTKSLHYRQLKNIFWNQQTQDTFDTIESYMKS